MAIYQKKPVRVAACKLPGLTDIEGQKAFLVWSLQVEFLYTQDPRTGVVRIPTLEGVMEARPGDWIIRGVKGEFYPCKDDIFQATYDRVEDE